MTKLAAAAFCSSSADCLPAAPFCDREIVQWEAVNPGLSFAACSLTCVDYGGCWR